MNNTAKPLKEIVEKFVKDNFKYYGIDLGVTKFIEWAINEVVKSIEMEQTNG